MQIDEDFKNMAVTERIKVNSFTCYHLHLTFKLKVGAKRTRSGLNLGSDNNTRFDIESQ